MTKRCAEVVPLLGPLFDAELPEDDREWVEDHLRGCASCTDRLALISAQSAAVRETLVARAASASFEGFGQRVLARIQRERKPALADRFRVWSDEMWSAHRAAFTATAGFALAACAALVVFFVPARDAQPDAQLFADASGPQVEEVDFGTHDGAVLQLPRDTTVIWMSDDKAVPQ